VRLDSDEETNHILPRRETVRGTDGAKTVVDSSREHAEDSRRTVPDLQRQRERI
jgi:hypothetical protein